MSYKVDGPSDLAFRFRFTDKNDDFLLDSFVKSQVFLHTIEIDHRLTVMIEVGEDTRAEQIRKVIPYALKLRDKLIEYQGAWSVGGRNAFLERLCDLHDGGMIYAEIANLLISQVEKLLREAITFDEAYRRARPGLKTYGEYFMWAYGKDGIYKQHSPASLSHAKSILEWIGLKEREITAWLEDGIENLKAGNEAFPQNPITRKKIIEVVRAWRKGKKHISIRTREEKARAEKGIT